MSLDIINAWPDLKPSLILDKRAEMPRHPKFSWHRRSISQIEGVCLHQSAGSTEPVPNANYHVQYMPNGTSTPGAPSLCYTFFIRRNGEIWWCNDLEDCTWSQGTSAIPGDENVKYIGICVGGNFPAPGYSAKQEPTLAQMLSVLQLIQWLCYNLVLDGSKVYGHYNFGKPFCPGATLTTIVEAIKKDKLVSDFTGEWNSKDWQFNLKMLGYDFGTYGPNKDGIDGDWGPTSKKALVDFQTKMGLVVTGMRDQRTMNHVKAERLKKCANAVLRYTDFLENGGRDCAS